MFIIIYFFLFHLFNFNTISTIKLIRHGARFPNGEVLKEYSEKGMEYRGQLTKLGKQQLFELGQYFKNLINDKLLNSINFSSSFSKRCIESTEEFMKGMDINSLTIEILPPKIIKPYKLNKTVKSKQHLIENKFHHIIENLWNQARVYDFENVIYEYCKKCTKVSHPSEKLKQLKKMSSIHYCNSANEMIHSKYHEELIPIIHKSYRLFYYRIAHNSKKSAVSYISELLIIIGETFLYQINKNSYYNELIQKTKNIFNSEKKYSKFNFIILHEGNITAFLKIFVKTKKLIKEDFYTPKFSSYIGFDLIKLNKNILKCDSKEINQILRHESNIYNEEYFVKIYFLEKELYIKECSYLRCQLSTFIIYLYNLLNNN